MNRLPLLVLLFVVLLAACQAEPNAQVPPAGAVDEPQVSPQFSITQAEQPDAPAATEPPAAPAEATHTRAPAAPAAASGPLEEIIAAMLALQEQGSFRVEQTVVDEFTNQTSMIEVLLPDRFRMTNPEMDMIIVEDKSYIKVEGEFGTEGEYLIYPASAERMISSLIYVEGDDEAQMFRELVTNAAAEGEDSLNGERVRVYSYEIPADAEDGGGVALNRLWVAVSDGLPRQLEISITGSEDGDAQITNIYQDYGADITIEAPEGGVEIPVGGGD